LQIVKFMFFSRDNKRLSDETNSLKCVIFDLFIYPRSNGIQNKSYQEKEYETENDFRDSFFRFFRVSECTRHRHLDTWVDEHKDSEKRDDKSGVFYETSNHVLNRCESSFDGTFVSTTLRRLTCDTIWITDLSTTLIIRSSSTGWRKQSIQFAVHSRNLFCSNNFSISRRLCIDESSSDSNEIHEKNDNESKEFFHRFFKRR
jgi:hypothetical protein